MLRKVMPVMALLASGTCCAAPAACFKPAEVEAANLRVLQQQFNVAALNCQTSDPHATFATRYNQFIKSFEVQLLKNSEILVRHFGKDGSLDRWMTRVANDAGQSVYKKSDFCQVAWDRLEEINQLTGEQMVAYAGNISVAAEFAPACPETLKKAAAGK